MRISDWSSDVCSSDLPAPRNCRGGVSFGKKGIGHKGSIDVSGIPALAGGEEFLRMWKQSNGNVLCVIDPAALGADPMIFGLAIVDAVRHGAKAYAQAVNVDEKHAFERSEERSVGKECARTCRSWWSPYHKKK